MNRSIDQPTIRHSIIALNKKLFNLPSNQFQPPVFYFLLLVFFFYGFFCCFIALCETFHFSPLVLAGDRYLYPMPAYYILLFCNQTELK